jgi:hypothetical protein
MKKFASSSLLAAALLIPVLSRAQGPSLLSKDMQVPATPITSPLSVGTAFNVSLNDSVDTSKAKPGDLVTGEIAEDVIYERSVIFPKGTKITGHIVRANSAGHGRSSSALFMQFDKAFLQGGEEVLLNAGIQALAVNPVRTPSPTDEAAVANQSEPTEAGVSDTSSEESPSMVSTIYDASPRRLRGPLLGDTTPQGEIRKDGLFTPDSKGAFGHPELKVYTPTSEGSRGTVLLSSKKNIHLDSGTHLLLVVQPPSQPDANADNVTTPDESNPQP